MIVGTPALKSIINQINVLSNVKTIKIERDRDEGLSGLEVVR